MEADTEKRKCVACLDAQSKTAFSKIALSYIEHIFGRRTSYYMADSNEMNKCFRPIFEGRFSATNFHVVTCTQYLLNRVLLMVNWFCIGYEEQLLT